QRASAFAYLSLFEGFGLPPIEAMARGVPTVTSNRTALVETAGSGAVQVDPFDLDAIGEALVATVTDDRLRNMLVPRGRAQAARYTPMATGQAALTALAAASAIGAVSRAG